MSDFDEGRGGGEVVIVAATHPTPLVSNSGGTQGQGMPFLAHKGKKKYTLTLIYLSTNVLPYVREAPKSRRQIWKDENERLSKHRPLSSCSNFNWFGIQLAEKIIANLLVGVINSQWKDFIAHKMQYKGTDCLGITLHRLDCHIVFCFILNAILLQIITL